MDPAEKSARSTDWSGSVAGFQVVRHETRQQPVTLTHEEPATSGLSASESQRNACFTRLARGDRSAIPLVFHELWPKLLAFTQRRLRDPDDAEDAAQRAMIQLLAQISDYDPSRSALAWALCIAAWECRTSLQKRKRQNALHHRIQDGWSGAPGSVDGEQVLQHQQMLQDAEAAVGKLSELDRQTLSSLLNPSEAAGARGATFRKRVQRALERLKSRVRKTYGY